MANKFFARAAVLLFCVLLAPSVFAQEQKNRFSQKLEWKTQSKAYEYKIEVRSAEGNIKTFTTKNTYIDISMPSGDYEFRVTAYDFLGRESTKSEWKPFVIKKAFEPKAKALADSVASTNSESLAIPLKTQDIQENAVIELIEEESGEVVAKSTPQDMKGDSAVFEKVPDGNYKIRITNPGGLFCETDSIKVAPTQTEKLSEETPAVKVAEIEAVEEQQTAEEKQIVQEEVVEKPRKNKPAKDFYIMAGADYLLGLGKKEIFSDEKLLIGADLKIEWLPFKIKKYKMGFNLQAQFFPVFIEDSVIKEKLFFVPVELNACFYMPLKSDKIYFGVQAGGGLIGLVQNTTYSKMDDDYARKDESGVYIDFMLDAGFAFRFIPAKHFAIDVTGQFEFWHAQSGSVTNATFGVFAGLRL